MNIGMTLKNYRCFHDDRPASFRLEKGFTALVGVNNSGKSTLLKFLWEFRPLFNMLSSPNGNVQAALRGDKQGIGLAPTIRDQDEVFCNRNQRNLTIEFDFSQLDSDALPPAVARVPTQIAIEIERPTRSWTLKTYVGDWLPARNDWEFGSQGENLLLRYGGRDAADLTAVYKVMQTLANCVYIPAYRNTINAGATQPYYDIQTGQAFISQWRAWQAGDVKQHSRAALRLTEAVRDIFGYQSLVVNASNSGETLQLYIDGESYLLPELGAGIAQFFMVLANVAVRKPPFVLIDEPELNLHLSLQYAFLRCLAAYVTEGVVFATHNLGLALAAADTTYSVRRVSPGRSEVHAYGDTPRLSEFLGEQSFAGYKALGFEKILLVEGVSDVRAIQHYLSIYGKQDKVVLLPLGGDNLINGSRIEELQEVVRICPNVVALIDSEKASATAPLQANRAAFIAACERLKPPIRCHVLSRRALENYFTTEAVQAVFGPATKGLAEYDLPPKAWKRDNWRVAQEMQLADLEATDLGEFLGSL
jgi:ABC-type Mn2+/Zn2+ transport system ATPase subunit